jgi:hypothetical protein
MLTPRSTLTDSTAASFRCHAEAPPQNCHNLDFHLARYFSTSRFPEGKWWTGPGLNR